MDCLRRSIGDCGGKADCDGLGGCDGVFCIAFLAFPISGMDLLIQVYIIAILLMQLFAKSSRIELENRYPDPCLLT